MSILGNEKLERTQSHSAEQLRIDDNQLDTSDTDGTSDIEDEDTWLWHESANESESDTEDWVFRWKKSTKIEEEVASQKPPKEIY